MIKKLIFVLGTLAVLVAAIVLFLSGPDLTIHGCTFFRGSRYLQDTRFNSATDVMQLVEYHSQSQQRNSLPPIMNTLPANGKTREATARETGNVHLAAPFAILLVDKLDGKSRHHFIDIPSLPIAPRLKDAQTLIVMEISSESHKRDYWGGISFHNVDDRQIIHQYRHYLELPRRQRVDKKSIALGRNQLFQEMLKTIRDFIVPVEPGQDSYANLRNLYRQFGLDADSQPLRHAFANLNDSVPSSQPTPAEDGLLYELGYDISDIKAFIRSGQTPDETLSATGRSEEQSKLDVLFVTPGCFAAMDDSALVVFAYVSGTRNVGHYGHGGLVANAPKAYDDFTRIVVMNWATRETVISGNLTVAAPREISVRSTEITAQSGPRRPRMASFNDISSFVRASLRADIEEKQ